jgi:hypothetical protein
MILDPICVETLRSLFTPGVARVSGFLRDPLLGRVCCIKMFRSAVFADHSVPNTIAQDADFSRQIEASGWLTLIALRYGAHRDEWHTFGEHRPSYSPGRPRRALSWPVHAALRGRDVRGSIPSAERAARLTLIRQ